MGKKRLYYIDVLNCIAIIFVLFLHSTQLAFVGNRSFSNFRLSLIVQSLCIPAIYIFIMNSGATLLDYREKYSTATFLKKRVHRVVIPFIIWSIIYYIYDIHHVAYPGPISHPHPGMIDFFGAFANNQINNIFWFFYTIIALYLFTPVISVLVKENKNTLFYIVIVYFICTDILQYAGSLMHAKLSTEFINQPLMASNFIGYFIMGYLIKVDYFNKKQQIILIISGFITLMLNIINDVYYHNIHVFNKIGPFLYSVALYLVVKKIVKFTSNKNSKILGVFTMLSSVSLGIYILHPFVYEILSKFIYGTTQRQWHQFLKLMNNPWYMFLLPVITYVLLTTVILVLKRIKFFNYLIP